MSLTTWRKEYFSLRIGKDLLEALWLSLKMWQGLSSENLEKHEVKKRYRGKELQSPAERLFINKDRDPLCRFMDSDCPRCPFSTDPDANDGIIVDFGCLWQYRMWKYRDDNRYMVKSLVAIIKNVIQRMKSREIQGAKSSEPRREENGQEIKSTV